MIHRINTAFIECTGLFGYLHHFFCILQCCSNRFLNIIVNDLNASTKVVGQTMQDIAGSNQNTAENIQTQTMSSPIANVA